MIKKLIKNFKKNIFRPYRKLRGLFLLRNKDFCIISNNCWGGNVYQDYGIKYSSPTIGLYFFAEEYIKFLSDLKGYINKELKFINCTESKYYDYMKRNNLNTDIPIGLLGDVEIMFLHYKDEDEAKEKWNRRKKRINWNNLLIKFNDQNLCSEDLINKFASMNFLNKICFTSKPYQNMECNIFFKEYKDKPYVLNDTDKKVYMKYINTTKLLNNLRIEK